MTERTSAVWRDDGVIRYIIPADTVVHTFMATFSPHDKWLCQVVNDLAFHVTQEDVARVYSEETAQLLPALMVGMLASHRMDTLPEGRMNKVGDMYQGTMHPTELSMLAEHIEDAIILAREMSVAPSEHKQRAFNFVSLWITAAKKFVRPAERMAALVSDTVTE